MRGGDGSAYQATRLTSRSADQLLDDLATLGISGVCVRERTRTYLVFAPAQRHHVYNSGIAVTLAAILALGVLVATVNSAVWIVLLPVALLPFVPLLTLDVPQLAVGAVGADAPGAWRLTVHGRVWGDLAAALDAYIENLPPPPVPPAAEGEDAVPVAAGGDRQDATPSSATSSGPEP